VIGRSIVLRGEAYTVVGVMPAGVRHPTPETAVWVPQSLVEPNMFSNGPPTRGDRYLRRSGRLAPGADAAQAQQELTALSAELAALPPGKQRGLERAAVVPLHTAIVGDVDRALVVVLAVVGFILLIGCANLANLLLARGSRRGGGRWRFAPRSAPAAAHRAAAADRERGARLHRRRRSACCSRTGACRHPGAERRHAAARGGRAARRHASSGSRCCLSALTGVLFGLVPALRMAHSDPQHDLRGGRGAVGADGQRLRGALVVAEVALAVLLVIGAGLMARSFLALRGVDPGFEPERCSPCRCSSTSPACPGRDGHVPRAAAGRDPAARARAARRGGGGHDQRLPAPPGRVLDGVRRAGADAVPGQPGVHADTRYVDPGYLQTMRIPLLRGEQLPTQLAPGRPSRC
jgi:hypothetical protein